MDYNKIINGNSLDVLKDLPDNSIDCCVTSPPYYALRDYGFDGQIGLEETPQQYIDKLGGYFQKYIAYLNPKALYGSMLGIVTTGTKRVIPRPLSTKWLQRAMTFIKNFGRVQNKKTLSVFRGCSLLNCANVVGICAKI